MLETQNLTRRFRTLTAVDALTISVAAGEVFGLLGPNGAGKTTVVKMLTTLRPPTAGWVTIAGFDLVQQAAEVRRVIGYVPQAPSADGELTGYENLPVFARLYDLPHAEREARIHASLQLMGLAAAAERLVRTYSGGMVRRLEVAQSVLHRPAVLFLDEPTIGLDPLARTAVWDHLDHLRADAGTTIVLTTHYMDEADRQCDRVAIIQRGRVAPLGAPAALKASLAEADATLDDVFARFATGAAAFEET